jgi:hypothetical protein
MFDGAVKAGSIGRPGRRLAPLGTTENAPQGALPCFPRRAGGA